MSETKNTTPPPGPLRMLAVWFYDLLLLIALWLAAGLLVVILNGGEATSPDNPFFPLFIIALTYLFYGWFWTHGGQTLGMRAWKVYLVSHGSPGISWLQAAIRFGVAIGSILSAGLGFLWMWFSAEKRSWHDTASGSSLVVFKQKKASR